MLRRWLIVVLSTALACVIASLSWSALQSRPSLVPARQPGPLVVISMPTLLYADTPYTRNSALWELARRGAVGALTTRNLSEHSCSMQSWLTLSAGARTSIGKTVGATPNGGTPGACPIDPVPLVDGSAAIYPDWSAWRHTTLARSQPADIGRIGSMLPQHGQCITAAGLYAGLGAADRDGVVTNYTLDPRNVNVDACPVTFIGLPGPDDSYLRWLMDRLPPKTTIVVAGMADDYAPESLHAVVIAGPGVPHGLLTSDNTRQRGVIATTDLSAFILSRLGSAAPTLIEGRSPLVQISGSPTAPVVRTTEIIFALQIEHGLVAEFLIGFFALVLGGWALGGLAWLAARRRPPDGRVRRWIRRYLCMVSATAAAMPVATFIVNAFPWYRGHHPRLQLAAAVFGIAIAIAAVALTGPWRRLMGGPAAAICLTTAGVIGLDVAHGSDLQFLSMLGLQPVYGGRYYGMGNVGFALLATSSLIAAAIVASPLTRGRSAAHGLAALTVLIIGAAAVIVDGYPAWGADGGGPAALIPAFAYLAINAIGLRPTLIRAFLIGVATVVIVGGFAVLDYLRGPADRTHLGDYVAQLKNGKTLGSLERIWQANWNMLTSSPLAMCVPLLVVLLLVVVVWPGAPGIRRYQPVLTALPLLPAGLASVAIAWFFGFMLNDSGTAIPPGGAMLLVPILALLAGRVSPRANAPASAPAGADEKPAPGIPDVTKTASGPG